MAQFKKQYLMPELIDQGTVVGKTMATSKGECWDGNPTSGNDNQRKCQDDDEEPQST